MKNKLLIAIGAVFLGTLAYGAVKTYVIAPKIVSSKKELLSIFFEARESLPPLPSPIPYEDVMAQLEKGSMDFAAQDMWAYIHDAGTYYLSDESRLAGKLSLPMNLVAYEDLLSKTVIIAGTAEGTKELQVLVKRRAPKFAPYDKKLSYNGYLMRELWPRRVIWTATLKPEADVWADMIKAERAAALSLAPMLTTMSSPEAVTELQLGIDRLMNGTVEIQLQWPVGFSDTLEIYSATNLVAADWAFAHTNISTVGGSEYFWNDVRTNCAVRFYAAGNAIFDEDGDGLASAREKFIYKTSASLFDTDGDGLGDGLEHDLGFNPLLASSSESLGDVDHDGFSNLEEQTSGTEPESPNENPHLGAVTTIRYYYDEDEHLTDLYSGTDAGQRIKLSDALNVTEEISAK